MLVQGERLTYNQKTGCYGTQADKRNNQNTRRRRALTVACRNADNRNTSMMKNQMKDSCRNTTEALRNPTLDRDITEMLRRAWGFD